MADVFISYARADRDVAERLVTDLEAAGLTVWFDRELRGGESFSEVIEEELAAAGKVIVIWSPVSTGSRWVRDEATLALEQGKLVPVLVNGAQPPIGFRQIHAYDLGHWNESRSGLPASMLKTLGVDRASAGDETSVSTTASEKLSGRNATRLVVSGLALLAALALLAWSMGWIGGNSNAEANQAEVMVMPLQAVGEDDTGIATGITDELIIRLRRVPGLRVVTGGQGAELAADAVRLDGSVRRDGDQLRVSARLADSEGEILWSDNFDRPMGDLFAVQEQIAGAVAGALSVSLDVGIDSRVHGGTNNPEAYAAYVEALALRYVDRPQAIALLERAIELDPQYIRAWSELSIASGLQLFGVRDRDERDRLLRVTDQASQHAYDANPDLSLGNSARAWYLVTIGDLAGADRAMRRVEQIDADRDPMVKETRAKFAIQLGRMRKAGGLFREWGLLDPIYRNDLNSTNLETLLGSAERIADLPPRLRTDVFTRNQVFWGLAITQGPQKAMEFHKEFGGTDLQSDVVTRGSSNEVPDLPLPKLREWAAERFGAGGRYELMERASAAAYLKKPELALDYMTLAFERPAMGNYFLLWQPIFADIRQMPRFAELMRDIGMVDAWRQSGEWGDFCREGAGGAISCT